MQISPEELARFAAELLEQLGLAAPAGPLAGPPPGPLPEQPAAAEPAGSGGDPADRILAANTRDMIRAELGGVAFFHLPDCSALTTAAGHRFRFTERAATWLEAILDWVGEHPTTPFSTESIRSFRPRYQQLEGDRITRIFRNCQGPAETPVVGSLLAREPGESGDQKDLFRLELDWRPPAP